MIGYQLSSFSYGYQDFIPHSRVYVWSCKTSLVYFVTFSWRWTSTVSVCPSWRPSCVWSPTKYRCTQSVCWQCSQWRPTRVPCTMCYRCWKRNSPRSSSRSVVIVLCNCAQYYHYEKCRLLSGRLNQLWYFKCVSNVDTAGSESLKWDALSGRYLVVDLA